LIISNNLGSSDRVNETISAENKKKDKETHAIDEDLMSENKGSDCVDSSKFDSTDQKSLGKNQSISDQSYD